MAAPGKGSFSGTASWIKTFRDSQAQRLRPARSFLSYRKYRRRIQEELSGYPLAKRLEHMKDVICECELVRKKDVDCAIRQTNTGHIGDIQHITRLGMGSCQGGFCTFRAIGIMQEMKMQTTQQSVNTLRDFLQKRFKGFRCVLWGDQLREEQLVEYIYRGILAMGEQS